MHQKIERTGREALEFDGELFIDAATSVIDVGDGLSTFQLQVFRHSEGGYVASIRYQYAAPNERDVRLTERLETDHDVENFFFAFEPEELCTHKELKLSQYLVDNKDELLRKLYGYYNQQVRCVIERLHAVEGRIAPANEAQSERLVADCDTNSIS